MLRLFSPTEIGQDGKDYLCIYRGNMSERVSVEDSEVRLPAETKNFILARPLDDYETLAKDFRKYVDELEGGKYVTVEVPEDDSCGIAVGVRVGFWSNASEEQVRGFMRAIEGTQKEYVNVSGHHPLSRFLCQEAARRNL